jgi:hypothetical protein
MSEKKRNKLAWEEPAETKSNIQEGRGWAIAHVRHEAPSYRTGAWELCLEMRMKGGHGCVGLYGRYCQG